MRTRLSEPAKQDLRDIRDWIAADNPAAAKRVLRAIQNSIEALSRHPGKGQIRPDLGKEVRVFPAQRPANHFGIFFRREENILLIIRVLHGSRDFPGVFKPWLLQPLSAIVCAL